MWTQGLSQEAQEKRAACTREPHPGGTKLSLALELPGHTKQPASMSRQEDAGNSQQGKKYTARPRSRSPPGTSESKHPHSRTHAELLERQGRHEEKGKGVKQLVSVSHGY